MELPPRSLAVATPLGWLNISIRTPTGVRGTLGLDTRGERATWPELTTGDYIDTTVAEPDGVFTIGIFAAASTRTRRLSPEGEQAARYACRPVAIIAVLEGMRVPLSVGLSAIGFASRAVVRDQPPHRMTLVLVRRVRNLLNLNTPHISSHHNFLDLRANGSRPRRTPSLPAMARRARKMPIDEAYDGDEQNASPTAAIQPITVQPRKRLTRSILAGIQRTGYQGKALPCLGWAAGGVGSGVDPTARREQQRDPNFAAPTA